MIILSIEGIGYLGSPKVTVCSSIEYQLQFSHLGFVEALSAFAAMRLKHRKQRIKRWVETGSKLDWPLIVFQATFFGQLFRVPCLFGCWTTNFAWVEMMSILPTFLNNCQIVTTRKTLHFSGLGIPININLEFTTMIGKWAPTQNVPSIAVPRLFKPNPSIFVSQLCRGLFIGAFSTLEKWDHLELCSGGLPWDKDPKKFEDWQCMDTLNWQQSTKVLNIYKQPMRKHWLNRINHVIKAISKSTNKKSTNDKTASFVKFVLQQQESAIP